jgi:hypothetical protein
MNQVSLNPFLTQVVTKMTLKVWVHKERYILVERFTMNKVSLNPFLTPFLTQVVTKMTLSCSLSQIRVIQTSQDSPYKAVAQG